MFRTSNVPFKLIREKTTLPRKPVAISTSSFTILCVSDYTKEIEFHRLYQTEKLLLRYTSEGLSLTLILFHPQEVLVGLSPRQQHSQDFIYVSKSLNDKNSAVSFDLMSLELSLPRKGNLAVDGPVGIRGAAKGTGQ